MRLLLLYGADILNSPGMELEKELIQHGNVDVFSHSVGVAYICLLFAVIFHLHADLRAMTRGALLHDYFLYDWHDGDRSHRLHGFKHAERALKNAERDFELGNIERNIIWAHMFPLNLRLPKCRESALVCTADKLCAVLEIFSVPYFSAARKAIERENDEKGKSL